MWPPPHPPLPCRVWALNSLVHPRGRFPPLLLAVLNCPCPPSLHLSWRRRGPSHPFHSPTPTPPRPRAAPGGARALQHGARFVRPPRASGKRVGSAWHPAVTGKRVDSKAEEVSPFVPQKESQPRSPTATQLAHPCGPHTLVGSHTRVVHAPVHIHTPCGLAHLHVPPRASSPDQSSPHPSLLPGSSPRPLPRTLGCTMERAGRVPRPGP